MREPNVTCDYIKNAYLTIKIKTIKSQVKVVIIYHNKLVQKEVSCMPLKSALSENIWQYSIDHIRLPISSAILSIALSYTMTTKNVVTSRGHSRSLEIAPFDRSHSHTSSFSSSAVGPNCIVVSRSFVRSFVRSLKCKKQELISMREPNITCRQRVWRFKL